MRPSVIYADPPYTRDQYSRYYHVYETLVLGDAPECSGRGLYRDDRRVSEFSLASKVEVKLADLIGAASRTCKTLLLSYPDTGLLKGSAEKIPEIGRQAGAIVECFKFKHIHSTLGASKGEARRPVKELLYRMKFNG